MKLESAADLLLTILLWVYFSSLILFAGSEFTQVLRSRVRRRRHAFEKRAACSGRRRHDTNIRASAQSAGPISKRLSIRGGRHLVFFLAPEKNHHHKDQQQEYHIPCAHRSPRATRFSSSEI
jgi:hypothetical protein